jgi:hypothetical protein
MTRLHDILDSQGLLAELEEFHNVPLQELDLPKSFSALKGRLHTQTWTPCCWETEIRLRG